jgi:predicted Fe-Mo cluster-binding NifX family protein
MHVPFLGKIPIIPDVVEACDKGTPAIDLSPALRESFEPILDAIAGSNQAGVADRDLTLTNTQPATKEATLRIAIPLAQGRLSMHFGHCEEFALIDVDEGTKTITRQERVPAPEHQPGLLPQWLHEQGAAVIVAGGMGSRAQSLFAENGIRVIVGAPSDEPARIIASYLDGTLATGANICDH